MRFLGAIAAAILFFPAQPSAMASVVTGYHKVALMCSGPDGRTDAAIRKFKLDGEDAVLVADPESLATSIEKAALLECDDLETWRAWEDTRLARALARAASGPYPLVNAGLTRSENPIDGAILTVDMCPSHHPDFDQGMFERLGAMSASRGPAPVGISMSGGWALAHEAGLEWLKEQDRRGKLAITWINHSYTHPYKPGVPEGKNCLLTPGVDFDREVLDLEKLLIERGITPSVFFRFPCLVSSREQVLRLRELFLIPLGADAWLATDQKAKPGSIILIHGNRNEEEGIRLFDRLVNEEWPGILFYPLESAVGAEK